MAKNPASPDLLLVQTFMRGSLWRLLPSVAATALSTSGRQGMFLSAFLFERAPDVPEGENNNGHRSCQGRQFRMFHPGFD